MPKLKEASEKAHESSAEETKTGMDTTGTGWGHVAAKKKSNDESRGSFYDVRLKDGESVVLQFLDDEPFCFEGHQHKRFNYNIKACQLTRQKHCLMCDSGMKTIWKAAFRVLDYRGDWDKDKKKFKYDKPVERVYLASNATAIQIKALKDKYGRELTELVLEITRSGSGANDTKYNFERAIDPKTDMPMRPIKHEIKLKPLRELIVPPKDNELIALGVNGKDDVTSDAPDTGGDDLPF